jgi:PKD repeat protein
MNASASYDPDGAIASYSWAFGDGNAGTGVTTSHAYSSAGTYTVTLTVQDNSGATGATGRQVLVQAPSLPDLAVQSLTYVPTGPTVGQSVTFTAVIVNQGAASSGAFRVRLDGSSLSTTASSAMLGAGAARSFSLVLPLTLGSETFTVRVDDLGQVAESNESNNAQSVAVTAATPAPIAEAGGPYAGTINTPISFNGTASSGSITTYLWSFGDGFTGQGSTVLHAYAATGTYPVTLTASGPGGQSIDTAQAVVGSPQPALVADVSLAKSVYTVGESMTITLTVNRPAYVYLVEIRADNRVVLIFPSLYEPGNALAAGSRVLPGGAYTLSVSEPVGAETLRLFAATGPIPGVPTSFGLGFPTLSTNPIAFVNTVLATMQSTFAAADRAVDSVSLTVQPAPPATGTLRVLSTPTGASVRLDGASIGTTNLERPNVSPGLHTVEISRSGYQTETRQANVTAGATTTVQVTLTPVSGSQAPTAVFTFSPPAPEAGAIVHFDGTTSADPGGFFTYTWFFGDGGTGGGATPTHAYATAGAYTVQLTVTDYGRRTGTASQTITVSVPDETGWVSPTFVEDPNSSLSTAWKAPQLAYDRDITTSATVPVQSGLWTGSLVFSFGTEGILSDHLRLMIFDRAPYGAPLFDWEVGIEVGGEWLTIYTGAPEDNSWFLVTFAEATVTRVRVRAHNLTSTIWLNGGPVLYEIQLRDSTMLPP